MEFSIDYISPEDAWLDGLLTIIQFKGISNGQFIEEYRRGIWKKLDIDINVGRDVNHGVWRLVGVRMAIYLAFVAHWDIDLIDNDEEVNKLWISIMDQNPEFVLNKIAEPLQEEFGMDIVRLEPNESKFFKKFCLAQTH